MYRFHSPDDRSESCSLQLPLPYEVREDSKVTLDGPPPRLRVTLVREPGIEFDPVPQLSRPGEAAAFIESILEGADREHLGAIYLDARSRMIGYIGTLTRTIAEPRGIFSAAFLCNAAAMLLSQSSVERHLLPTPESPPQPRGFDHRQPARQLAVLARGHP